MRKYHKPAEGKTQRLYPVPPQDMYRYNLISIVLIVAVIGFVAGIVVGIGLAVPSVP